jgi:hypothetical protein
VKEVVVIIQTSEAARVREALRAAVGLGLRGDRVRVVGRLNRDDPWIARALATLAELGHEVEPGPADVATADVVEVWT